MPGIKILPDALETEQQHRLGVIEPDRWGDEWSYVEFPAGTYQQGQIMRDSLGTDLVATGTGTLTDTEPVGARTLHDTGEFSNKGYLVGAIGVIVNEHGIGQQFVVRDVQDNDTLIISVNGQGWRTALTTSSQYRLMLPGRVVACTQPEPYVRGVIQRAGFTVPANEVRYGWLKRTGFLQVLKDISAQDFSYRQPVFATTGGLAIGVSDTESAAVNEFKHLPVGYAAFGEPGGTVDVLQTIIGVMDYNRTLSGRMPVGREQGYTDNHGNPITI